VEARQRQIFGWFGRILPPTFFERLKDDLGIIENSCIFTLTVTSWLMIMQRLSAQGTLATAVSELVHGNGRELLEPCKRVREESISAGTGAYSQARQRVPVAAARRITERTFEQLHGISSGNGLRDRLFLLDGSSIRLMHTPALIKAYPQAENQHGKSHWPVMRIGVMHHVVTALAMAPEFGPMYGSEAVGEQGLAEALIDRLPDLSALIADRNFGVFSVVWHTPQPGAQGIGTADRGTRQAAQWRGPERGQRPESDMAAEPRRSSRTPEANRGSADRWTADRGAGRGYERNPVSVHNPGGADRNGGCAV